MDLKAIKRNLCKNKIKFPQEFKVKSLTVYSQDTEIKDLLKEKSFLLRDYLEEQCCVAVKELEELSKNGTSEELTAKNREVKLKKELVDDFFALYDDQYLSKGYYIEGGLVVQCPQIQDDYNLRHGKTHLVDAVEDPISKHRRHRAMVCKLTENEIRRRNGERAAGEFISD